MKKKKEISQKQLKSLHGAHNPFWHFELERVKGKKAKVVNFYSASSQARLYCPFVTNQSRLPHGHHVQPADTA